MFYLILPIFLIVIYEFIGRYICYKLKFNLNFCMPIGLFTVLAIMLLTLWPITVFNASFYILLIVALLIHLCLIILTLVNIKKINWKINFKLYIFLIIIFAICMVQSYFIGLGERHGFDSQFYLGMIIDNVESIKLNEIHPYFGTIKYGIAMQYKLQSYYYIQTIWAYISNQFSLLVNYNFFYLPSVIWTSTIIFNYIFASSILDFLFHFKIKSKIFNLFLVCLLVLFVHNHYFYTAFSFIGNGYRIVTLAYFWYFLSIYFIEKSNNYLIGCLISIYALLSFSSSGFFIILIGLISSFIPIAKINTKVFKFYSLCLFMPVFNFICVYTPIVASMFKLSNSEFYITNTFLIPTLSIFFILTFIIFLLIYKFNDCLYNFFYKKNVFKYMMIFFGIVFLLYSLYKFGFTIEGLIYSGAQEYDMNIAYTNLFYPSEHLFIKIIILLCIIFYMIKSKSEFRFSLIFAFLIFFNPFTANLAKYIIAVYSRCFDYYINPFTLILIFIFIFNININKKIKEIFIVLALLISIFTNSFNIKNNYYHISFKPEENFNYLFKLDDDLVKVMMEIKQVSLQNNIESPAIICEDILAKTFIPHTRLLYGREKQTSDIEKDKDIYNLFWPYDYYYDPNKPSEQKFDEIKDIIAKCSYNFLILNKEMIYYNPLQDRLDPIYYLMQENAMFPILENDKYMLYYLDLYK